MWQQRTAFEVRPARPGELDAVGTVVLAAYRHDLSVSDWYAAQLADARARSTDGIVVAAVGPDEDVLGGMTYVLGGTRQSQVASPWESEIRMLGVRPDARGRGIAAALVRWALEHTASDGRGGVALCTQPEMLAAHRLYERLGFARSPDLDWSPAEDSDVRLLGYRCRLDLGGT